MKLKFRNFYRGMDYFEHIFIILSANCPAGYGGPTCRQCEAGTYKQSTDTSPCRPCPEGRTSPAGAKSPEECKYFGSRGWSCYGMRSTLLEC